MNCLNTAHKTCSIHDLIEVLIAGIEEKDLYTKGHSDRVSNLSSLISSQIIMSELLMKEIHMAAHLHDLGKIYVSDQILNKPGPLSNSEWEEIKRHPEIGGRLLSKVSGFDAISKIVKHHHERWEGYGYPDGLKKHEIPLGSRIIAIADAIDAMLSTRPYRKPLSIDSCIQELEKSSGTQFDPELVPIAVKIIKDSNFTYDFIDTTINVTSNTSTSINA